MSITRIEVDETSDGFKSDLAEYNSQAARDMMMNPDAMQPPEITDQHKVMVIRALRQREEDYKNRPQSEINKDFEERIKRLERNW